MTCGPATDHRNKKCVLTTKSLQTEAKGSGPCQGLDWPGGWSRLPPRPLRGRPRAAVSPSLQASLVLDKVHSPLLQFGSTCFAVTLFILWSVAGPQKSNFRCLFSLRALQSFPFQFLPPNPLVSEPCCVVHLTNRIRFPVQYK